MLMKKNCLFSWLCLLSATGIHAQSAQVVMNNDGYIVLGSGAYLVVDNTASSGITQTGTGGRIISESETGVVRWNVSNATGTYVIPFYDDDDAQEIPMTLTIGTAGTAGATNHIDFSTYDGGWDNNTYRPTGVTNMGNITVPAANNSAKVIDRFWMIDANHATKPAVTLSFTYIDNEWSVASNTIAEANLRAQRWNATVADWDGFLYPPTGSVNTAANTVSAVSAPAADFFRVWTLVDNSTPLPVELISNSAECSEEHMVIRWSTASETNNNYFTLEKSMDGTHFITLGTIPGAGTSSSVLNYSFVDYNSYSGTSYYRLSQTDYNGDMKTFGVITAEGCPGTTAEINAFNDQSGNIAVLISGNEADNYTAVLFDAQGKKIAARELHTEKGENKFRMDISSLDTGLYFISIDNGRTLTTKKIFVD
jgi:hypothetical protein